MRTRLLGIALVALTVAGCAAPSRARWVDLGDRRLRLQVEGQGSPTVVFDAGLGERMETWSWVWPEVARWTRVCLYDRAGLGRSDPGPLPRTSERIVDELRALLDGAGIGGPYVLVGHSFGALNMRLFAARYPEQVAGLVLVDPTPIDFPVHDRLRRTEESRRRFETQLALASEAARSELEAVETSAEQVRARPLPPEIPVFVISSTRPEEPPEFRETWTGMQTALARSLGADRFVVSDVSGHYIQFDQPELVIGNIRAMVEQARDR